MIAGTDDHVGPGGQGLDDGPTTEVGVGRDDLTGGICQRLSGVQVGQRMAGPVELADSGKQVVTLHVGHRNLESQSLRQLPDLVGQPGRD